MHKVLQYVLLASALGGLSACDAVNGFFAPQHKAKHHARGKALKQQQQRYAAEDYIQHLTLAKLALADKGGDAAADLAIVNAYASTAKKAVRQPLVTVNYKDGGKTQRIAMPIAWPGEDTTFPNVQEAFGSLNKIPHELHDIHIATLNASAADLKQVAGDDKAELQKNIDAQLLALLSRAAPLPALQEAQLQLRLAEFFTDRRIKDAAYLTLDNAKQSLAKASRNKADSAEVEALSHQLEAAESKLHTAMPFSWNGN